MTPQIREVEPMSATVLQLTAADAGMELSREDYAEAEWAQRIVTFQGGASDMVAAVAWPYKLHIWLGLMIFFVFPFSRLVHIWSAPVGYVFRKPQVGRRRGGAFAARAK